MKNEDKWQPSLYKYENKKLKLNINMGGSLLTTKATNDILQEKIEQHSTGNFLDLGCGTAPYYCVYKDYVDEVSCVDWGESWHDTSYTDIQADLSKNLPLEDDSFDTILLTSVLEHIPNPEHLFSEMKRILKNDGKLILQVPFLYWLHEQPNDYYRYTQFALERFCKINELKILSLQTTGSFIEVITDILSKLFCQVPLIGNITATVTQNIIFYAFRKRRKQKSDAFKYCKSFPLGYILIAQKK